MKTLSSSGECCIFPNVLLFRVYLPRFGKIGMILPQAENVTVRIFEKRQSNPLSQIDYFVDFNIMFH